MAARKKAARKKAAKRKRKMKTANISKRGKERWAEYRSTTNYKRRCKLLGRGRQPAGLK